MPDTEPVGITQNRLSLISAPWNEPFIPNDLPTAASILEKVFQKPDSEKKIKAGEVINAKNEADYIGMSNEELKVEVPRLINKCLDEMSPYETISRKPAKERLVDLKKIADDVTIVLVRSSAGDYYHLNKEDRYKDDPSMQGAERVRSDQATILAIVLAGIKAKWPDEELLLFLNQHVLTDDNQQIQALREKARQAILDSKIRIVYTGREDEVWAANIVLRQKNIFIPSERVDILDPKEIDNTVDQTKKLAEYLHNNLQPGEAVIEPSNIQGIRSMRMAKACGMIPPHNKAYIYAMGTVGGEKSLKYRTDEVKGTVFYALTGQAAFDPAPYTII